MSRRFPSRSPTMVLICASASLMVYASQSKTSSGLALQANDVQVLLADPVRAADQILDVVVLGVDVPPCEGVGPTRGEDAYEPRRQVRRGPRRVVGRPRRHLRAHETGG